MKKKANKEEDYSKEYEKIMRSSKESIVVNAEWMQEGDYFQKFSMYDDSYLPVKTLGNTTLIEEV